MSTSIDPDYAPVPKDDDLDPPPPSSAVDGADRPTIDGADFPSSFHRLDSSKSGRRGGRRSPCPRGYNARRRLVNAAAGGGFLVVFGVATVALGGRRGHIKGMRPPTVGSGRFGYEGRSVQPDPATAEALNGGMTAMSKSGRNLTISTWNIAAINNNPFEYWITYPEDPEYERLMIGVENFIEYPGDRDVEVGSVFTDSMYDALERDMDSAGWDEGHEVREYWEADFRRRRIVSGFLKDPLLGSKRLASMPDRVTNTIGVADSDEPACRPTVINMYGGDLSDVPTWWEAWERFMFRDELRVRGSEGEVRSVKVYQMLLPIRRSKYPDVTEDEERLSLPLSTVCAAIFDAILVHMMNSVSAPDRWQGLKRTMVENLNRKKVPRTLEILRTQYGGSDIITLQEVSLSFVEQARGGPLGQAYHIIAPIALDAVRDQNSVIMLKKSTFPLGALSEISSLVEQSFPRGADVPVAEGDILAITARDADGVPYVVASFHGDTNGLATKPVLDALVRSMSADGALAAHTLVFGLDANTYEHAKPGRQQDVMDFGRRFARHGISSAWGDAPQPSNYTTFNARTYLQPQLNKACRSTEKRAKGDVNPKDFVLFKKSDFDAVRTWKDNTGDGATYEEGVAFPTLGFPSDHGILTTVLRPRAGASAGRS